MKRVVLLFSMFALIIGFIFHLGYHKPILLSVYQVFYLLPKSTKKLTLTFDKALESKIDSLKKQAISQGVILPSQKEWMKCKVNGFDAKFRLKGDLTDHIRTDKISFKIKLKKDTLFGMTSFSIQHPNTKNFIYEWLFHDFLKSQEFIALQYDFVSVSINEKNNGIYALEESIEPVLFHKMGFEFSPVVKFNEENHWAEYGAMDGIKEYDIINSYENSEVLAINKREIKKAGIDKIRKKNIAIELLQKFKSKELKSSEVFDLDKLIRFLLICNVTDAHHALSWRNVRFYLNDNNKLVPIGCDGDAGTKSRYSLLKLGTDSSISVSSNTTFLHTLFADSLVRIKYQEQNNKVESNFAEYLFEKDVVIQEKMEIINHEFPRFKFEPYFHLNDSIK